MTLPLGPQARSAFQKYGTDRTTSRKPLGSSKAKFKVEECVNSVKVTMLFLANVKPVFFTSLREHLTLNSTTLQQNACRGLHIMLCTIITFSTYVKSESIEMYTFQKTPDYRIPPPLYVTKIGWKNGKIARVICCCWNKESSQFSCQHMAATAAAAAAAAAYRSQSQRMWSSQSEGIQAIYPTGIGSKKGKCAIELEVKRRAGLRL